MTEYYIPTRTGEAELVEKRSRFLGHVWRVASEEEARARIEETRKRHYDARHNCWCYILKDGPVRYSDDGEPQGTAGQPMLNVFQREGVVDVCCVVTRYFGGILLGAGGLVRAYTQSAKDALDAAGISVVRRWVAMEVPCTYAQFEGGAPGGGRLRRRGGAHRLRRGCAPVRPPARGAGGGICRPCAGRVRRDGGGTGGGGSSSRMCPGARRPGNKNRTCAVTGPFFIPGVGFGRYGCI